MKALSLFGFVLMAAACSAAPEVRLASTPAGEIDHAGAGQSSTPRISKDGQKVLFLSHAPNLVTNSGPGKWIDVFMRDLATSYTVLLSVSRTGSSGGNGSSFDPVFSEDGLHVAFVSEASDLVENDTNDSPDIFIRDLPAGVTRLASVALNGVVAPDPLRGVAIAATPLFANPMLSASGRWLAFESRATNLTSHLDTNQLADIFLRDLESNTTHLVSAAHGLPQSGSGSSRLAGMTPDARRIVFISTATNLTDTPGNVLGDVYVFDPSCDELLRISGSVSDFAAEYRCRNAAISDDGGYVAFTADVGTNTWLFRHNLNTGTSVVVSSNCVDRASVQLSASGRFIAFDDGTNVYSWDGTTGVARPVNVVSGETLVGARNPVVSGNGRGIIFVAIDPALPTPRFQLFAHDIATGTTRLLTRNVEGAASSADAEFAQVSVDHSFARVVFDSVAGDLADSDFNESSDVFLHEWNSDMNTLLSIRNSSQPRVTALGHSHLGFQPISADGNVIAFTRYAPEIGRETNATPQVVVRDLVSGSTMHIGNRPSDLPALSGNGRYVAYVNREQLSPMEELWRLDRVSGKELLVGTRPVAPPFARSGPSISGDGSAVAFRSNATLVVWNVSGASNETVFPFGHGGNSQAPDALFTADSRFVVFESSSDLLPQFGAPRRVYAWDRQHSRLQVATNFMKLRGFWSLSSDSRFVAFGDQLGVAKWDLHTGMVQRMHDETNPGNFRNPSLSSGGRLIVFERPMNNGFQISLRDSFTGDSSILSIDSAGNPGTGHSFNPLISGTGRFVVFWSSAPNLVAKDHNGQPDVFVHDRLLGVTLLASANVRGESATGPSARPIMAADGRTVVFQSLASDLIQGDYNDRSDLFVLRLGGPDSDGDGLDDDWEVAYFGDLSRDGFGDFDGDGVSDADEFRAGTDPTNRELIVRILTLTRLSGGGTRLIWVGNPAGQYQVQYKESFETRSWTIVNTPVTWNGSVASGTDPWSSLSHRFYRVVRVQ